MRTTTQRRSSETTFPFPMSTARHSRSPVVIVVVEVVVVVVVVGGDEDTRGHAHDSSLTHCFLPPPEFLHTKQMYKWFT